MTLDQQFDDDIIDLQLALRNCRRILNERLERTDLSEEALDLTRAVHQQYLAATSRVNKASRGLLRYWVEAEGIPAHYRDIYENHLMAVEVVAPEDKAQIIEQVEELCNTCRSLGAT